MKSGHRIIINQLIRLVESCGQCSRHFIDRHFNRAIRQLIIDGLIGSQVMLANGPVFPETWAYFDGIEHFLQD